MARWLDETRDRGDGERAHRLCIGAAAASAHGSRSHGASGRCPASGFARPRAFAHAEKLRREADAALHSDDLQAAQFLAERAIAAYQHAEVLARAAIARDRLLQASTTLAQTQARLGELEAEQQRIAAEADALELRLQVMRDAAPLASSGPADAARESARMRAARSLALDARLLCAATRLLGTQAPSLGAAESATADLEKRLQESPKPAPIDAAMRARASCLTALTEARRPASAASSLGRSDQLLAELSAMGGLEPTRDERGVVVILRTKAGDARDNESRERLISLARVAEAHPTFPLQVVVHDPSAASESVDGARRTGERSSHGGGRITEPYRGARRGGRPPRGRQRADGSCRSQRAYRDCL